MIQVRRIRGGIALVCKKKRGSIRGVVSLWGRLSYWRLCLYHYPHETFVSWGWASISIGPVQVDWFYQ